MNDSEMLEETGDLIGAWLEMVDRASGEWISVADLKQLPDAPRVQVDSEKWCALFYQPNSDPHRSEKKPLLSIHHSTRDTADIIRYEYGNKDLHLKLYETVDFALLRVELTEGPLLSLSQDEMAKAVISTAGLLLNKPDASVAAPTWDFSLPKPLGEGSRFSSGASQDPHLMPSWTSRVDGGILHGKLYFMCFKKRQSGDGKLIILNSHHWFDGQAWAPYEKPRSR